ncbi:LCCL domain-containing protein [bacterium]|nr:LCCL domain-containing protein [bacterium]
MRLPGTKLKPLTIITRELEERCMRFPNIIVIAAISLCTIVSVEAEYSHQLLFQQGDIAPGTQGSHSFKAFDSNSHSVDDDGEIIFRAQLEDDSWGYWRMDESVTELLFLESSERFNGFKFGSLYQGPGDPIIIHQTAKIAGDPSRFYDLVSLKEISLLDPGVPPQFQSVSAWDYSGSGILAAVDSFEEGKGNQRKLIFGSHEGLNTIDSLGSQFVVKGRTYETTNFGFIAGSSGNFMIYMVEGEYHNDSNNRTEEIKAIRLKYNGWLTSYTKTIFTANSLWLADLSVGNNGMVAFKGKLEFRSPWGIYAGNQLGKFSKIAEEGGLAPGTGGETFDTIRRFQVSDYGEVTFMGRDSSKRWGIWSGFQKSDGSFEVRLVALEGMISPYDSNLVIDQIMRGVANDNGLISFVSIQKDLNGRFAGTTYWTAFYSEDTKKPVHEPILTTYELQLILPDGQAVRGTEIVSLGNNLFNRASSALARSFNRHKQITFQIQYSHPTTYEPVDSLWISSPRTLIVNSLGDEPDALPGDGIADVRENSSDNEPITSLRAAIEEANALGGSQRIIFHFDPDEPLGDQAIIRPQKPLPEILGTVELDASFQLGQDDQTNGVVLDGTSINTPSDGLVFNENGSRITGMTIRGFKKNGITSKKGTLRLVNVDIENNQGKGIHAKSLIIRSLTPRQSVYIQHNGAQGIHVEEALDADACHVQYNGDQGILSDGPSLLLNSSDTTTVLIRENGGNGIDADNATEINGGRLSITSNGKTSTPPGNGLVALKAHVALFNSTIKDNRWTGLNCKSAELFGGLTLIEGNGEHGIHVSGDLVTEEIRILKNSDWGILSEGDRLIINEDDDGTSTIQENKIGGIDFSGEDLFIYDTEIKSNGVGVIPLDAADGEGIYAPNATATLDDVKIINNGYTGITAKNLNIWGNLGTINQNGRHGAKVLGNFHVEDACSILENIEWGLVIEGEKAEIGSALNPKQSLIKNNNLGGIQFLGTTFEGTLVHILDNGSIIDSANGLFAPNASVFLNDSIISGNTSNGVVASNLEVGGITEVKGNEGNGALVLGNFKSEGQSIFSNNDAWGLVIQGESAQFGTDPTPLRSLIENNFLGGVWFIGSDFKAWSLNVSLNGDPSNLGKGLDASLATVVLDDSTIAGNAGIGLEAHRVDIAATEFKDQGGDGLYVCPGPVLLEDVRLSMNAGSGLVLCDGLEGGQSVLHQVEATDNALDGIRNENVAMMNITESLFKGNARFAVTNAVPVFNVIALGNDWGHPSGPSGAGPGIGQPVSNHVLFQEVAPRTPLEIFVNENPVHILAGAETSIPISLRHDDRNQELVLVASDSKGWLLGGDTLSISLSMSEGSAETTLYAHPPADAISGETSEMMIEVTITSGNDSGESFQSVFLLETPAPTLTRFELIPTQAQISVGESVQLEALMFDQFDRPMNLELTWNVNPNQGLVSVSSQGLFTAPNETGEFQVEALTASGQKASATFHVINDPQLESGKTPENPLPDPGNGLTAYRSKIGEVFFFMVTGREGSSLWGTDIYTDDSDIGVAAVHTGIIQPGETAILKVTILPGQDSYESSERNGITSSSYGQWTASYRFETYNPPQDPITLRVERNNGALRIAWDSNDDSLILESTSNLATPTIWIPVTDIQHTGERSFHIASLLEQSKYYRLRR